MFQTAQLKTLRPDLGEGGWFHCIAQHDGAEREHIRTLPEGTARLPGEGHVVFALAAQYPAPGECYEHERVIDAAGELVGWLSYDTC